MPPEVRDCQSSEITQWVTSLAWLNNRYSIIMRKEMPFQLLMLIGKRADMEHHRAMTTDILTKSQADIPFHQNKEEEPANKGIHLQSFLEISQCLKSKPTVRRNQIHSDKWPNPLHNCWTGRKKMKCLLKRCNLKNTKRPCMTKWRLSMPRMQINRPRPYTMLNTEVLNSLHHKQHRNTPLSQCHLCSNRLCHLPSMLPCLHLSIHRCHHLSIKLCLRLNIKACNFMSNNRQCKRLYKNNKCHHNCKIRRCHHKCRHHLRQVPCLLDPKE